MTQGRSFHLVPLLACLGILAGCGEGGRTPTSPEPMAAVSAAQLAAPAAAQTAGVQPQGGPTAVVADASRDGGLPRRHRDDSTPERRGANPHHGGGTTHPGGTAPGPVQLSLTVQPDVWDLDLSQPPGTVAAVIAGTGLDAVDRGSIVLEGPAGTAKPLRVERAGDDLEAVFARGDALGVLDSPLPGERRLVKLRLTASGAGQVLSAYVHLVGKTVY
jgi:hypothetical protein